MNVPNVLREWDYTNERVLFWMDLIGDFEWVCSTITSQNIYGHAPTIILLTMWLSRLFVKIRCHAVPSTRKRSAVRKSNSEKSKRSRKPSGNKNNSCKLDKRNAGLEDLRVKRDRAVESTGTSERSLRYFQEHQIKNRRGGPIHLSKRAVEKQEWSLTEPERPGEVLAEDTVQLRSDRFGLEGSQQRESETLPILSKEPLQRTRRTAGGSEEYGDRQLTTKQPQCGSIRRRSDRYEHIKESEKAFQIKSVPDELKAEILLNILGERVNNLPTYVSQEDLSNYVKIKELILREFEPTPQECLNNFKKARKLPSENYVQFASRLSATFDYYCVSCVKLMNSALCVI
ncbi:uncharacterized protein TNCV_3988151 [Trichonephila clavipes]|nr:uncharacterized protein TNCV_3988151 [Trichonephila clavipes]